MTTRLILTRHGQTDWNLQRRFQGQQDRPLTELGIEQANQLAARLQMVPIDAIYSSPLQRAHRTAEIIAAAHNMPVITDPRLSEMAWGIFEGLTKEEVLMRYPETAAMLNGTTRNIQAPGGETRQQCGQRMQTAVNDIVTNHPNQTVLLVSHGGALSTLMRVTLGLEASSPIQFHFGNCTLSELLLSPNRAPALLRLNDDAHITENNHH